MTYKISGNGIEPFTVQADNYSEAAGRAARKLQRDQSFGARRTSGTPSMSGWFQAYTGGNPQTATGLAFHVTAKQGARDHD